jgi:hypothetical protein
VTHTAEQAVKSAERKSNFPQTGIQSKKAPARITLKKPRGIVFFAFIGE